MTFWYVLIGGILGIAAFLSLTRVARGPSVPDRAVALEVVVTIAIAGAGVYAAFSQQNAVLPILLVVSLLAFIGAVSISRFGTKRDEGT